MGERGISLLVAVTAVWLALLACSFGSTAPAATVQPATEVSAGATDTPVSFMPEASEAPTEDPGECESPTPQIDLGVPVEGQVPPAGDPAEHRVFYCVMIPEKSSRAIFELSGTSAALNLYVGYPDLETVQQGGILYWSDTGGEAGDKRVVAEMGLRDFLFAGPYYIEISPQDSSQSSPFALMVTVDQP